MAGHNSPPWAERKERKMPMHTGVEVGTELLRDDLTKWSRRLAHKTVREVPHIATLYEVLSPSIATKGLSVAKAFLPEFDTKTASGKFNDFLVDLLEAYILELPEAVKGVGTGMVHHGGSIDPSTPMPAGTATEAMKFIEEWFLPHLAEFSEFTHLLGPRARAAMAQYILTRPTEEFTRFLALTVGKRLAILYLLVPKSPGADIERLETGIRVRWNMAGRIMADATALNDKADLVRLVDRQAAAEMDIRAGEMLSEINELPEIQSELLILKGRSMSFEEALPKTASFVKNFGDHMVSAPAQPAKKFGWFDRKIMQLGGLKIDKQGRRVQ